MENLKSMESFEGVPSTKVKTKVTASVKFQAGTVQVSGVSKARKQSDKNLIFPLKLNPLI